MGDAIDRGWRIVTAPELSAAERVRVIAFGIHEEDGHEASTGEVEPK